MDTAAATIARAFHELSFSSVKDVLLFLLAIYGAALSTFNWRQAVRKESRQVQVRLSTAMPTYHNGQVGPCYAKLEAINIGQRSVTVTTLALELPSGGRLFAMARNLFPGHSDTPLPTALGDGQSASLYLPYQDIAAGLVQSGRRGRVTIFPVCEDSTGKTYRGAAWIVNTEEFARM